MGGLTITGKHIRNHEAQGLPAVHRNTEQDLPSDERWVRACLTIANYDAQNAGSQAAGEFLSAYLVVRYSIPPPPWVISSDDAGTLMCEPYGKLSNMIRAELKRVLDPARHRSRAQIDVMIEDIKVHTSLQLLPNSSLRHVHRYEAENDEAIRGLLWAYLMDPDRPFGKSLRRCQHKDCRAYFFVKYGPKGGGNQKYCSDDCALSADRAMGAERTRRYRARKRREAKRDQGSKKT